jgi:DNA helicase II / ATP-dependent DNA helicase PcrA
MKTIILGPPGTGKTTTLLDLVDQFMKVGVDSKRIGYFSFTRKAAHEAASRAAEKFNLDEKEDLIYFRTLHSLAFRLLGIKKERVMKTEDYREFGLKVGIPIKMSFHSENDGVFNSDNEYLRLINKARVMQRDLMDVYDDNRHTVDVERDTLFLLNQELNRFKEEKGMIDYDDMLENFITQDVSPSFDVLFIDEAQDLSPLQWRMVRSMWSKSDKTYIAGDDDQAIFKWAGADVDHFIALREDVDAVKVLDQSYRIPGGPIHELSQKIIAQVENRYDKEYKPRDEIGKLHRYADIAQVDMSEGQWLVLTQAHHFLDQVTELCYQQGWYFSYKGKPSVNKNLLAAIHGWEQLRKGESLATIQLKNIYYYLGDNVTRGYRTAKTLNADLKYNLETCISDHGLQTDKPWHDSFAGLNTRMEMYIRNMLAQKENIFREPRIILSTIHGAKGGEADNVLLFPDITKSALDYSDRDADELHRLFYVAVTRAKKALYILEPKNYERAYLL